MQVPYIGTLPIAVAFRTPAVSSTHLYQWVGNFIVDLFCVLAHVICPIKGELFGWVICGSGILDEALATGTVHADHHIAAQLFFTLIERAAAHYHLHCF